MLWNLSIITVILVIVFGGWIFVSTDQEPKAPTDLKRWPITLVLEVDIPDNAISYRPVAPDEGSSAIIESAELSLSNDQYQFAIDRQFGLNKLEPFGTAFNIPNIGLLNSGKCFRWDTEGVALCNNNARLALVPIP